MLEVSQKEIPTLLYEEVYSSLSKSLMRGEFEPGQKLTLRTLAATLGTSMTPIREAIRHLAAHKAIEIKPNKYILIPYLSAEKYMEIVDTRKLLEGHAAARASERVTLSEIKEIVELNKKILAHAKKGNFKKAMIENQRFHFAIYKAAKSETLMDAIETQWLKIGPSLSKYLYGGDPKTNTEQIKCFKTHNALIRALKKHDPNEALKAMTNILDSAATQLFKALQNQSTPSLTTLGELWKKKS